MLRVRTLQLETMQLAMVRATAPELARDFRRTLGPAVTAEDPDVAIVDAALLRAWGYGLRANHDLRAFAQLAWSVGARFDEHPAFTAILRDPALDPAEKLPRLWKSATPRDWLEASAR